MPGRTRAVFLDRDGVINQYRKEYVRTRNDFAYYECTAQAMGLLGSIGLPLMVVTNQSGIARGYTTEKKVQEIHEVLTRDAERWNAPLLAIEYCPHHPAAGCRCRKPEPQLFEKLAAAHGVSLAGSYLIGDAPSDVKVGKRLSMITLRVATGRGEELDPEMPTPDHEVADVLEAAQRIAHLESEHR
ncbi:MAG: HAD-IIIA family hydrolase [Planctomycetota bacterium]